MSINKKKYIEAYIKIRDKAGKIIPLTLNEPQMRLYEAIKQQKEQGKPIRVIILKARQMGFSTETESLIFEDTSTKQNVNSGIVAHKDESTTNLFNMSKLMYEQLPEPLKPQLKASNAKELIFDTDNGKGLKSKIKCMTAGSNGIGRSDTFNNLHISELAFWQGDKKLILLGLLQAVPNLSNTMIIIESTANGYDYFKELWDMAVKGESDYIPLFVGWSELKDYQMPYDGSALTQEEEELQRIYNLSNEQLMWRRWCIKNNCGGDIELFKQEYPINPHEAFISTGNCVFDKELVINRLEQLPKPIKTGFFIYDYDGLKITDIRFVRDLNGYIKIYQEPNTPTITKYAIGGDTAGEGSDNFTAHVIDVKTGIQCAVLKNQFDEDLYAKQVYCLGMYYKEALIGLETNFSTYPVMELQRLGYPNQYIREKTDTYTGKLDKSFGFKTDKLTRPLIIANLVELVREHTDIFNDKDTLEEMLTFVRNEKGRPEAQQGAHDDLVMGISITHYIKDQVIFNKEPIVIDPTYQFNFETPKHGEIGSRIMVV